MALASLPPREQSSSNPKYCLPDHPVVNSYTQQISTTGTTLFNSHKFGTLPTTGTYGYHNPEIISAIIPSSLGVETLGPYSGTDATGFPDPLHESFQTGHFLPDRWHQNNYNKYYTSFADRDQAQKIRHEAKNLIHATDARTKQTQHDVTKKLQQRAHDINYWKNELEREIEEMEKETTLLCAEKVRLEKALDATATPLMIATECLKNRERRQDIDLVHDEVEIQLKKEVELIRRVQELLKKTIAESDKQIKLNRKARHELNKDWGDKKHAHDVDCHAGNLNNYTTVIMYRDGVEEIQGGNSTPQSWAQHCHDNICRAENERMASIQLRGLIDDVLTDVANDQREQANCVDKALAARIEEMHEAKRQMEHHLKLVCKEITDQEKNIADLEQAIRDKEAPMKVAQSRLEARTHRPRDELCDDPSQHRLLEEVQEIKASIKALQEKKAEAEDSRALLMHTRRELETEIGYKQDSLFIDREKCQAMRTRYPTITRLVGYQ